MNYFIRIDGKDLGNHMCAMVPETAARLRMPVYSRLEAMNAMFMIEDVLRMAGSDVKVELIVNTGATPKRAGRTVAEHTFSLQPDALGFNVPRLFAQLDGRPRGISSVFQAIDDK